MTGREVIGAVSQGSLRVPPELSDNDVVSRLLLDNQQLRDALRQSNLALRERCEEMEAWQQRSRKEREFLSCRFQEARALVERLSQENQALMGRISPSAVPTHDSAAAASHCEIHTSPEVAEREVKQDRRTDVQSPPRSLHYEGESEFFKLLKSDKEKLEEGLRELRRRNELLEREKEDGELERHKLSTMNAQLQLKLQTCAVMEEASQRSDCQTANSENSYVGRLEEQLQVTQSRYRELQEKFESLEKCAVSQDKLDVRQKAKEKDVGQMTDSETLKAQVTSLLGELHERQSCLEKSDEERKRLKEMLTSKTEALKCMERDVEHLKKQHNVTVDKLRLQTENLEAALKKERLCLTDEKRKLAQLQHAYTRLFQDYDKKLKSESQAKQRGGEIEDLTHRLAEAERALALKQELIDKLKEEVEQQKGSLETVPVLNAQAEIYKADFLAEREAREKLNQQKEDLQEQLNQVRAEVDRLKQEGTSRARIEEMQQRHMEDYRNRPHLLPQAGFPSQPPSFLRQSVCEELPDYRCPKCQYQAPEMDTLQIHVMDCIQ